MHTRRPIPLRDDILQQDYRALYLAWLAGIDSWEVAEDSDCERKAVRGDDPASEICYTIDYDDSSGLPFQLAPDLRG